MPSATDTPRARWAEGKCSAVYTYITGTANPMVSDAMKPIDMITTAFGALTVGGERAKGTSVSFSVAADLMSVSATPPATNSIEAQLLSEEFVGSMVTLFFEAKDGTELKVQMPERSFAALPLDTSRSVYLNFAPENAQLLKD